MGRRPHNVDSPLRQVESEPHQNRHLFSSGMWQKIHHFFAKDDPTQSPIECSEEDQWSSTWDPSDPSKADQPPSRPVGVGLPRQATFRRQNSERRERLLPVEPGHAERRAVSSTRHVSTSLPRPRATSSPPYWDPGRVSAPAVGNTARVEERTDDSRIDAAPLSLDPILQTVSSDDIWHQHEDRPPRPPSTTSSDDSHYGGPQFADDKADLRAELDSRWILNLSMHFRDKSDREKFFVTYAQTPNHWRRVTISCDYRNAEPGSLEMDLKELQFQRDKSLQIYESIRDSLPEIQFYDTVTNLKLETTDGRLHVHVTEDVNEIIPYPPRHTVAHILNDEEFQPLEIPESELIFDSHLSGFVYKVRHKGKVYIKKEIPGPDTVDEFLYEINALHALHGSSHVIALEAIVLDDTLDIVKGLLISYAEKGAIVDLLYDHRGSTPWEDRCRWAEHAVRGLSEIHEEGYVQGDFTLSNIVVDEDNNAKIIDINRRGCPVGWEPPEIATKIASNQRISMYIGEKSDLYQLGMTLWALAMDDDEPERHVPPLSIEEFPSEVPDWYQSIVRICLSARPRDRLSAKDLIDLFPEGSSSSSEETRSSQKRPTLKLLPPKEYIDPANAVERDDIERLSHNQQDLEHTPYSPESSRDDYTFTYPKSSNYELESESSAYDRPRGRRPPTNFGHLGRNERHHWIAEDERSMSVDEREPNIVAISPGMDREYFDEVELNGHPYLISRGTFNLEEMQILEHEADPEEQASNFDSESVDIAGPLDPAALQSPRRPPLAQRNSATSDITPRGSHAVLPAYTPSPPAECLAEPISAVDLNNLGSHPDLNLSPVHGTATLVNEEEYGASSVAERNHPPSFLCEDSGFDEPSHYIEEIEYDDLDTPIKASPLEGAGLYDEREKMDGPDPEQSLDIVSGDIPDAKHQTDPVPPKSITASVCSDIPIEFSHPDGPETTSHMPDASPSEFAEHETSKSGPVPPQTASFDLSPESPALDTHDPVGVEAVFAPSSEEMEPFAIVPAVAGQDIDLGAVQGQVTEGTKSSEENVIESSRPPSPTRAQPLETTTSIEGPENVDRPVQGSTTELSSVTVEASLCSDMADPASPTRKLNDAVGHPDELHRILDDKANIPVDTTIPVTESNV